MKIRAASVETDLPKIVEIIQPYESNPVTVDLARSWFQFNPPGRIQCRRVAVDDLDAVIAYSGFVHEAWAPAGHFVVWVIVEPAFRRQGIGSALWEAILTALKDQGATRQLSDVRDDDVESLRFAERRGFCIDGRLWASVLDLADFDETPYLPAIRLLEAQGIRFVSLADYPDTPETRRKLFDLNADNVLDIPGVSHTPWDFPAFEQFILGASWFRREGQLLAVDGDTWAGLAAVSLKAEAHSAYNEHTGVRRAYRGRKIAQALKVQAVRYARQHGALTIRTNNDSLNAPILAINQKMGYRPEPGKYLLVREIGI